MTWRDCELAVDNAPQRRFERGQWQAEAERLRKRRSTLDLELNVAFQNWTMFRDTSLERSHFEQLDQLRSRRVGIDQEWLSLNRKPPERSAAVSHAVRFPVAIAGAAILPAGWAALTASRWRRRKASRSRGLCLNCGYDLRATPGRCPECGMAVPVPASG